MGTRWERFDWLLDDAYHLRSNLRDVRAAVRKGQFRGPEHEGRRKALYEALKTLENVNLPSLPGRSLPSRGFTRRCSKRTSSAELTLLTSKES